MKKTLIILTMLLTLAFVLCACAPKPAESVTEPSVPVEEVPVEQTPAEEVPAEDVAPEIPVTEFSVGDTISLDFVEMTFTETGIAEDIRQEVTVGNVTRITGPEPLDGQQYVYLRGTIKNLATTELPVYDFFLGEFNLEGYRYNVSANECNITSADGSHEFNVPPLTTYDFIMYAAIPNELVDMYTTGSYRFGFYEMFDNEDLSRNRAFEEDPIALCPYQYQTTLK